MIAGKIYLYSWDGDLLQWSSYRCRSYRTKIINTWKILYGYRYLKCFLHIEPDSEPTLVRSDGTNANMISKKYRMGKLLEFEPS